MRWDDFSDWTMYCTSLYQSTEMQATSLDCGDSSWRAFFCEGEQDEKNSLESKCDWPKMVTKALVQVQKTRNHIASGAQNFCLSVQTFKIFQADHCSVSGNSVFILTKQMHNHQILQCLVHICTQCGQRIKLCSGIANNSKTCSASKFNLFTHQQWWHRSRTSSDVMPTHSSKFGFKGLAKLIKKAHLLQWPSTRHWRPGMLCIVLIAHSNHDWNIILFRNANCLSDCFLGLKPFHGVGLQAMRSSCEQKMGYCKHDIFHCPCLRCWLLGQRYFLDCFNYKVWWILPEEGNRIGVSGKNRRTRWGSDVTWVWPMHGLSQLLLALIWLHNDYLVGLHVEAAWCPLGKFQDFPHGLSWHSLTLLPLLACIACMDDLVKCSCGCLRGLRLRRQHDLLGTRAVLV